MQLEISSLKENKGKSLDFKFEEMFSSIDLGGDHIDFEGPVVVEGTATNVESGILIDSTIKTGIVIDCDRCLKPVGIFMEIRATEEFVDAMGAGFERDRVRAYQDYNLNLNVAQDQDGEQEKEFRTYKGNTVDIRDMTEENILLNVPMKILCSEACKGLCPSCGTDLNVKECSCHRQDVDPRMEKLKDWFKE